MNGSAEKPEIFHKHLSLFPVFQIYEVVIAITYNLDALYSRHQTLLLSQRETTPDDDDPYFSPNAVAIRHLFYFQLQPTSRSRS